MELSYVVDIERLVQGNEDVIVPNRIEILMATVLPVSGGPNRSTASGLGAISPRNAWQRALMS